MSSLYLLAELRRQGLKQKEWAEHGMGRGSANNACRHPGRL